MSEVQVVVVHVPLLLIATVVLGSVIGAGVALLAVRAVRR
ncbi:hypothetical protein CLV52_2662 [Amnibacterium kyonggiense]|uniref:Uncharacterized protein n=1 Tax=Amnibacterium kyonggiense TaxID=595671 RepID=A0A4R7FMK1_9MICO|nr:hypothetical protein CLV52_2662 [Amnibacterium kyonggiense]